MSVPWFVMEADVVELQEKVRAFALEIGNDLTLCPDTTSSGYALAFADWQNLRQDCIDFIAEEHHFWINAADQYGRGDVLFQRLEAMRTRLGAMGCTTAPAPPAPSAEGPPTPDWLKALQWGVVAVVVAAGAYGVSQVVQAIPKPRLQVG